MTMLLSNGTAHEIGRDFVPTMMSIATSLAHTNRYNGHFGTYSVAQHCVMVSRQLPPELQLAGLLHDAPEAYIGDIVTPVKQLCPELQALEDFYHDVIDQHWDVQTRHPQVKEADLRMLVTEAKYLRLPLGLFPPVEPYPIDCRPWKPEGAKRAFIKRYKELT